MSRPKTNSLCGPDCRYRTLYEGSQASLSDMAGNQAAALARVGRLRSGMVTSLKQTFPVEFGDAEAQLGKRMSSVDDEVLLAYLTAFLAMPKAPTAARSVMAPATADTTAATEPAAGFSELRAALAAAGVPLPQDDDPRLWADSVRKWSERRTPPQVTLTAPDAAGTAPHVVVSEARLIIDEPAPAPAAAPNAPTAGRQSASRAQFGFDADLPPVDDQPSGTLGADYFPDEHGDFYPDFPDDPGGSDPAGDGGPLGTLFDPTPAHGEGDDASWDSLFDDTPAPPVEPVEPVTPNPVIQPAPAAEPTDAADPSAGPRTAAVSQVPTPPSPAAPGTPAAPEAPFKLPPLPFPTAAARDQAPAQQNVPADTAPVAARAEEPPTAKAPKAAPKAATRSDAPAADKANTGGPGNPAAVSTRQSGPIKPEAMSPSAPAKKTSRRKPTKKVARVTAAAPGAPTDPRGELAQVAGAHELTDDIREKLLATVYMPRPVFIADLAHLVGNAELVEQWQNECYANGADSPVRFLAAKARHKARGALIIPRGDQLRGSSDFETSVWRQCIDSSALRGAKLYELAVLLHRVLDNLVTLDIGDDIVTLRLNQSRGLVGVILVLSADLHDGSPARAELAAALEGMARGRLSLLAVCTYTGGNRAVPDLAEAARADIDTAGLVPAFPVIAQSSWEFAADGGTSAISVIG